MRISRKRELSVTELWTNRNRVFWHDVFRSRDMHRATKTNLSETKRNLQFQEVNICGSTWTSIFNLKTDEISRFLRRRLNTVSSVYPQSTIRSNQLTMPQDYQRRNPMAMPTLDPNAGEKINLKLKIVNKRNGQQVRTVERPIKPQLKLDGEWAYLLVFLISCFFYFVFRPYFHIKIYMYISKSQKAQNTRIGTRSRAFSAKGPTLVLCQVSERTLGYYY